MNTTERDIWELQNLLGWLATRSQDELALDIQSLIESRRKLDEVIARAKGAQRHAA